MNDAQRAAIVARLLSTEGDDPLFARDIAPYTESELIALVRNVLRDNDAITEGIEKVLAERDAANERIAQLEIELHKMQKYVDETMPGILRLNRMRVAAPAESVVDGAADTIERQRARIAALETTLRDAIPCIGYMCDGAYEIARRAHEILEDTDHDEN